MKVASDLHNLGGSTTVVGVSTYSGGMQVPVEYCVFPRGARVRCTVPDAPDGRGSLYTPTGTDAGWVFNKHRKLHDAIVGLLREGIRPVISCGYPGRQGHTHPLARPGLALLHQRHHLINGIGVVVPMNAYAQNFVMKNNPSPAELAPNMNVATIDELYVDEFAVGQSGTKVINPPAWSFSPMDTVTLRGMTEPGYTMVFDPEACKLERTEADVGGELGDGEQWASVTTPFCPLCNEPLMLLDAKIAGLAAGKVQTSAGVEWVNEVEFNLWLVYELFWVCEWCDQELFEWPGTSEIVWT